MTRIAGIQRPPSTSNSTYHNRNIVCSHMGHHHHFILLPNQVPIKNQSKQLNSHTLSVATPLKSLICYNSSVGWWVEGDRLSGSGIDSYYFWVLLVFFFSSCVHSFVFNVGRMRDGELMADPKLLYYIDWWHFRVRSLWFALGVRAKCVCMGT